MNKLKGRTRLAAACVLGAVVWLIVLPWLAQQEIVRERIRRNEQAGIDPTAMFYTDLEHLHYDNGLLRQNTQIAIRYFSP